MEADRTELHVVLHVEIEAVLVRDQILHLGGIRIAGGIACGGETREPSEVGTARIAYHPPAPI